MAREKIVVLDFGSQYAHLIAKRFRMLGYYSEIALPSSPLDTFTDAKGIVFSGGPSSVYDENTPEFNPDILGLDIPILGLCYGHYMVQQGYGGKVGKAEVGEFGFAELHFADGMNGSSARCPLFKGIDGGQQVWMSHQEACWKWAPASSWWEAQRTAPLPPRRTCRKSAFRSSSIAR